MRTFVAHSKIKRIKEVKLDERIKQLASGNPLWPIFGQFILKNYNANYFRICDISESLLKDSVFKNNFEENIAQSVVPQSENTQSYF